MYVKVKVITKAKKEKLEQKSNDHFVIAVKEPAEANLANRRVVAMVKEFLGVKNVKIVSGHHSPSKILSIE